MNELIEAFEQFIDQPDQASRMVTQSELTELRLWTSWLKQIKAYNRAQTNIVYINQSNSCIKQAA